MNLYFGILFAACADKPTESENSTYNPPIEDSGSSIQDTGGGSTEASGPILSVNTLLDFNILLQDCHKTETLILSNSGDSPLSISQFTLSESAVFSVPLLSDPVIQASESLEIQIEFEGSVSDIGHHQATLLIESNDETAPSTTVELMGEIIPEDRYTESFQSKAEQVDILLTYDRSMYQPTAYEGLTQHIGLLTDHFNQNGVDFHLMAVTAESGCVNGSEPFIDATTPSSALTQTFENMIDLDFHFTTMGANPERAFTLMHAALQETLPGGCNDHFLRSGADLVLISLSDEPEQSIHDWSYYLNEFSGYIAPEAVLTVNGVGGDSCSTGVPSYLNYEPAIFQTDGLIADICTTDWLTLMTDLANHSLGKTAVYPLSILPVGDIDVQVDGQTQTSGWSYDAQLNAIVFQADATPHSGAAVDVHFTTQSCE